MLDAGSNPARGHRDPPRADARLGGEHPERPQRCHDIREWLPHPHEDDVGHRSHAALVERSRRRPHLVDDLGRRAVAAQPHVPGGAERTSDCASHLAADADRRAPPGVRSRRRFHRHRLDGLAVGETAEELDGHPRRRRGPRCRRSPSRTRIRRRARPGVLLEAAAPTGSRGRTAARRLPGSGGRARPVRRGGTGPGPRPPRPRCSKLGWASVHGTDDRVCRRQPRRLPCV